MLNTRVLYSFEYTFNIHRIQKEISREYIQTVVNFSKRKSRFSFKEGL